MITINVQLHGEHLMDTFPFWPGSVVSVRIGPVRHVGIAISSQRVISCSLQQRRVVEETLEEFSGGHPVTIEGYPGTLPPFEVIARARAKLGTPWDLFSFNCEHFVNWAHGRKADSPQLRSAVTLAMILGLVGVIFVGSRTA